MISRWMPDHGLAHGYAHGEKSGSLRAMVGRALAAIAILETTKLRDWTEPAWPEFIPTLPLAPSIGVLKDVKISMDLLYCDESNLENRAGEFLLYGGIRIPGDQAAALSTRIEALRAEA
ncbi:hypothetical protein KXV85_004940, partial [Aspergillus fumigatus]